jgi:hypothetical protein
MRYEKAEEDLSPISSFDLKLDNTILLEILSVMGRIP